MSTWYGSLNIDGIPECAAIGGQEDVIAEMMHYIATYGDEIDLAQRRITITIQKGKPDDTACK